MRAAVLREYSAPLAVERVPDPVPGPREALVRVRAAGICGTDLKLIDGALRGNASPPMIPGHEVAGELVEPTAGLPAGKRVAIYLYSSCGECRWCQAGQLTICPFAERIGIERDGGLAEMLAVPVECLLPFEDELPFERAAVSMDAVASPWAALHGRARIQPGERLAVVGAGGLGSNGIQIAVDAGAAVVAIDVDAEHRELALESGAEIALRPDQIEALRDWAADGVDIALETSGTRAGFLSAAAALRPGGRVVCCGYQPGVEYGIDSSRIVLEQLTVMGSRSASRAEAAAALAVVERGAVSPTIMAGLPLDAVNAALGKLRAGEVRGRLVVIP